jgi:hypothetical protein
VKALSLIPRDSKNILDKKIFLKKHMQKQLRSKFRNSPGYESAFDDLQHPKTRPDQFLEIFMATPGKIELVDTVLICEEGNVEYQFFTGFYRDKAVSVVDGPYNYHY